MRAKQVEERRLRAQIDALSRIAGGYLELFGELDDLLAPNDELRFGVPPSLSDDTPRGADAVRRILHESMGNYFLVSEIVTELAGRNWLPASDNPANAIRSALERLVATGDSDVRKATKYGKVAYGYDPDEEDAEPF